METLDAIRNASQAETSDRLRLNTDAMLYRQREMVRTNKSVLSRTQLAIDNSFRMHTFGQAVGSWPIVSFEALIRLSGLGANTWQQPPARFGNGADKTSLEKIDKLDFDYAKPNAPGRNHMYELAQPAQEVECDTSGMNDVLLNTQPDNHSIPELADASISRQVEKNQLNELREEQSENSSMAVSGGFGDWELDPDASLYSRTWQYNFPSPFAEEPDLERDSEDSPNTRTWQFHFPAPFIEKRDVEFVSPSSDATNQPCVYKSNEMTASNEPQLSGSCLRDATDDGINEDLRVIVTMMLSKKESELSAKRTEKIEFVEGRQHAIPRNSMTVRKCRLQHLRLRLGDEARFNAFTATFQSLAAYLIIAAVPPILLYTLATIADDLLH